MYKVTKVCAFTTADVQNLAKMVSQATGSKHHSHNSAFAQLSGIHLAVLHVLGCLACAWLLVPCGTGSMGSARCQAMFQTEVIRTKLQSAFLIVC
ncbi:hypothetical protein WOLCODRAFT_135859 [Wolfiporia cocos MD-104 SS10]|uniref:Uncharacterized protein n=1 Tax=Wolfiporia cocos (strain MD-104) TaxID=742152 RepID=A0A2H3JMD6_WOLCO|nr:hypothetical protein WOLCODRAFT_135859 [Wolfiporia cocos MD-104 SS10]